MGGGTPVYDRPSAGQQNRVVIQTSEIGSLEFRKTMAPLLGHWVVLLAMTHGRAPLPVSPNLWKGLLHRGFPNNLDELGNLARRYMFLGDARMLLAELGTRPQIPSPLLSATDHPGTRLEKVQDLRAETNANATK